MTIDRKYGLSGLQAWPTMFFTRLWESHLVEKPQILSHLRQLQSQQPTRIASGVAIGAKSEHGLYESDFDLFKTENASLQRLVKFIEVSLAMAVSIANNQEAQPQNIQIDFVDSWYHITNDGGYHDAHVHHGCSWCGIYYLQLGDACKERGVGAPNGGSRFYCPFLSGGAHRDFGNKYLAASIDAPIEDGLLILFPSFLLHSGLPYRGETDRIVLAFNARAYVKQA